MEHRGSLNLELALMICLLVLVCVASLGWMGSAIANQYNGATARLSAASFASPDNPTITDGGGGSYLIGWSNGTPPFDIIRGTLPDLSDATKIGSTPGHSYTVQPIDLSPGDNYLQIRDGDGRTLPLPIVIATPQPSGIISWTYTTPPFQVIRSVQPDLSNPETIGFTNQNTYTVSPPPGEGVYYGVIDADALWLSIDLPALPLVCPDPSAGLLTATTACVETPQTDGSGLRNPMIWIDLADYALPPVGWPGVQTDPATGDTITGDELCLRCHAATELP